MRASHRAEIANREYFDPSAELPTEIIARMQFGNLHRGVDIIRLDDKRRLNGSASFWPRNASLECFRRSINARNRGSYAILRGAE